MQIFIGELKGRRFHSIDGKELKIESEFSDGLYWIFGEIQNDTIKPDLASKLSGLNLDLFKKSRNKLEKIKGVLNV